MWFFTVCSDRFKCDAISLFVSPCAIKGTSCCCLRVKPSSNLICELGTEVHCRATVRNSGMESWEGQMACPCATERTAEITSADEASFSRYPTAPARTHFRET